MDFCRLLYSWMVHICSLNRKHWHCFAVNVPKSVESDILVTRNLPAGPCSHIFYKISSNKIVIKIVQAHDFLLIGWNKGHSLWPYVVKPINMVYWNMFCCFPFRVNHEYKLLTWWNLVTDGILAKICVKA